MSQVDEHFFERADEHINTANKHLSKISKGKVSASMMYATSRFNSWISATEFQNAADMESAKQEILEYFIKEYRAMLEENLNDYIENFDNYMNT